MCLCCVAECCRTLCAAAFCCCHAVCPCCYDDFPAYAHMRYDNGYDPDDGAFAAGVPSPPLAMDAASEYGPSAGDTGDDDDDDADGDSIVTHRPV